MAKSYKITDKDHEMFWYFLSTGAKHQHMADLFGCGKDRVNWIIDHLLRKRIQASVEKFRVVQKWKEESRAQLIDALENQQTDIAA